MEIITHPGESFGRFQVIAFNRNFEPNLTNKESCFCLVAHFMQFTQRELFNHGLTMKIKTIQMKKQVSNLEKTCKWLYNKLYYIKISIL